MSADKYIRERIFSFIGVSYISYSLKKKFSSFCS